MSQSCSGFTLDGYTASECHVFFCDQQNVGMCLDVTAILSSVDTYLSRGAHEVWVRGS